MNKVLAFVVLAAVSVGAYADCECQCVNGQVRALCSSPLDIRPICSPAICPFVPPSIQPIATPMIPPIGTRSCRPAQVLNPFTGQYEWKTVCQ